MLNRRLRRATRPRYIHLSAFKNCGAGSISHRIPALKTQVDEAFAARNSCFRQAMRPLVRQGLRNAELAEEACRACDRQVIAAARIWFEANKHRYIEPDLDSQIKGEQKDCPIYALPAALEMPKRMADEADQLLSIAKYGEWQLTEELNFEGRIAYRLTLPDHKNNLRNIQLKCSPSGLKSRVFIFFNRHSDYRSEASEILGDLQQQPNGFHRPI